MAEPSLRRALAGDAPVLAGIADRAYGHYVARIGQRPAPMDADYDLNVARDEVWVADVDGELAGFVVLLPDGDDLLLENVAVDPPFQGRGVGQTLLDLTEQRARSLDLDGVRLYTHVRMTENQRLYERRGYVETGRVHEEGLDRVYYRKDLPRSRGTRMPNT
jgi:ribosomal protein S18 acetylase RimI-like enzyme